MNCLRKKSNREKAPFISLNLHPLEKDARQCNASFIRSDWIHSIFVDALISRLNEFCTGAWKDLLHLFPRFHTFNIFEKKIRDIPISISGQSKRPLFNQIKQRDVPGAALMMWNLTRGVRFKKLQRREVKNFNS